MSQDDKTKAEPKAFWFSFRFGPNESADQLSQVSMYKPIFWNVHAIDYSAYVAEKNERERLEALLKDRIDDWKRIQDAERRAEKAEAELERFCCHGKNPHDCDYSACAGTEGYTAKEWVLVEERDELRQKLEAAESKRSELSEWNKTLHRELDNRSKSLVAMMEKRDALVLENELLRKEVAVIRHHVGLVFALANTRHIRARLDKALAQADAIKKQREELK